MVTRCVLRRKNDDRAKPGVDDLFNVIDVLDEHLVLTKLPIFVARKLDRMPPFRTDELDICMAVQRISTLEEKALQLSV